MKLKVGWSQSEQLSAPSQIACRRRASRNKGARDPVIAALKALVQGPVDEHLGPLPYPAEA